MKKENRIRIYARYLLVLFVVLLLSFNILRKEIKTTVIDADKWNARVEKFMSDSTVIAPERGNILSADGKVLATNLMYYDLRLDFGSEGFKLKKYVESLDSLADSLAAFSSKRSAKEWKEYLKRPLSMSKKPRGFLVLKELNVDQFNRVKNFPFFNLRNRNQSGLIRDPHVKRCYPYGKMAKRSIGHVNQSKNREIHGYSGIESSLDSLLYGKPGYSRKTPMLTGIYEEVEVKPVRGYDLVTTIDINMQEIVENELNDMIENSDAEWGVAVLMEVPTGDIKAISNLEKERVETDSATRAFRYTGRIVEGMNRAVSGFEPGSVVKPISMLIALEHGAVKSPSQVFQIGSSFAYAGGKPIRDSHFNAQLTAEGIIEQSSNIGMTKVTVSKFGANPQAFKDALADIGFFEPMHTGIAGERVPIFAPLTGSGARINLSRICYGYASEIPPLYTLSIYNAIANNGRYVRPHLVNRILGNGIDSTLTISPIRERICSERNAAILREMLRKVVWGDHGTAKRLRDDNVAIAGKTGTCKLIDEKTHQYMNGVYRFAFCGFFPAENPQYSCIVLICHPRKGTNSAAATSGETLKNIALKMYSRGMLNHYSDYRANASSNSAAPTFFASLQADRYKASRKLFNTTGKSLKAPASVSDSVPNVLGLSLREAISTLEFRGFNVRFSGSGHVVAQRRQGNNVELTLKL